MPNDLLSQLKTIHLPAPISWWPLTPAWYVLFFVLIFIVVLLFLLMRKLRCKRKRFQYVSGMLLKMQQQNDLKSANVLLKRVAITLYPEKNPGSLTGESWLIFLDEVAGKPLFQTEEGRHLLTVPYQKKSKSASQILFSLIQTWMRTQL